MTQKYHAHRNLKFKRIGADEIWAYTKFIVSYLVGKRTPKATPAFRAGHADRLANRIQLTTEGLHLYLTAVERAFKWNGCDFAQIVKTYGQKQVSEDPTRRYSPAVCTGAEKVWIMGGPDMDKVSTSYVERASLTMQMGMRRLT